VRLGLALALLFTASGVRAEGEADVHLFAGARHFREARFEEALLEFRVAGRLGRIGPALWYSGAVLVKLGRHDEAIEAFATAEAVDRDVGDAMLSYYRAVALYESHLLLSADRALAAAGDGVGPRIVGQIADLRGKIAAVLERGPGVGEIDAYHHRAENAVAAGRPVLAAALLAEAVALGERRGDGYRSAEARATLARLALAARTGPGR
jgi:tetratricopeptide (TPR) repeat protein